MIEFIGTVRTDNALASITIILFGMTGSVTRKALDCLGGCLDFIFLMSCHMGLSVLSVDFARSAQIETGTRYT